MNTEVDMSVGVDICVVILGIVQDSLSRNKANLLCCFLTFSLTFYSRFSGIFKFTIHIVTKHHSWDSIGKYT